MTESLSDHLLDPSRRPAAVAALAAVVEAEVGDKSGISGTAIKAGYKSAQKMKPNVVANATDAMLPEFLTALQPFWDSRQGAEFGAHLAGQGAQAAEALLAVTDARAQSAKPALAKVYSSLRNKAADHVLDALPRLGAAIQSQMA